MSGLAPSIHASEKGTVLRPDEAKLHESRFVLKSLLNLALACWNGAQITPNGTWNSVVEQSPHHRAELLVMAPALENKFVRVPKIATGADSEGTNPRYIARLVCFYPRMIGLQL